MKIIIVTILLVIGHTAFADSITWNAQTQNEKFKTNKIISLQLDDKTIVIPKDSQFELFEISELNMIKVYLHKYKMKACPSHLAETDLELVQVSQPDGTKTSVGVNLAKGCNIEIFIDMKEYNTKSFLK